MKIENAHDFFMYNQGGYLTLYMLKMDIANADLSDAAKGIVNAIIDNRMNLLHDQIITKEDAFKKYQDAMKDLEKNGISEEQYLKMQNDILNV